MNLLEIFKAKLMLLNLIVLYTLKWLKDMELMDILHLNSSLEEKNLTAEFKIIMEVEI